MLLGCCADQVPPPFRLYCQVAPDSMPLMLMRPSLVMWSLLLVPVSLISSMAGALGAVLSSVTVGARPNTT